MSAAQTMQTVVGVLSNRLYDGALPAQSVDEKYLLALIELSGTSVVIIPALEETNALEGVLDRLDGLVFTGAASNIHPDHFDPTADEADHSPFDPGRDKAAFELIRLAVERDMPLLAICRGMQELNVIFGGSLDANIFEQTERHDHRPWSKESLEKIYGAAHSIVPVPGGRLAELVGTAPLPVNSVHVQAIDRLGAGLKIEGQAEDGTIEAISVPGRRFMLGVQWHPEFMASNNSLSRRLFEAFGIAVQSYAALRKHESL